MKKKMFTIAVAVALMLTLSAPFTAARASSPGAGSRSLSDFSTLLDVSVQTANGEISQYYKSYAFAEQGKTALKWKEIKSGDLTIGLKWDISKVVTKPGKLILSSVAATGNKASSVSDCETSADDSVNYVIYTIVGIAPNPVAISKEKVIYTNTGSYIDIGTDSEWSRDGYIWRSADSYGPNGKDTAEKWCSVAISTEKQTVFVRGKAKTSDTNSLTLPSTKSVKVLVAAMPKAPKVNIYISKGFLSMRAGMEISNDGNTWAKMNGTTIPLGAVTDLPASGGSGTVKIDLNNDQNVYVRTPAGNGKPPSDTFETRIKFKVAGNVSPEYFIAAPGMKIQIDNSVAIEAFVDGKWKRIKTITAASIPSAGLKVRMSGAKDRLPGAESMLKLVSKGGYKEISIT